MEILSEQVKSDIENSRLIVANPTHIAVGIYFKPELLPIPFISVMETNQRALAVRAYAEKVGVPVVRDIPLARRIFASHRRYSLVSLDEVEEVLRLLMWLEQVENAGVEAPEPEPSPLAAAERGKDANAAGPVVDKSAAEPASVDKRDERDG